MLLRDRNGREFDLSIVGYEFPDAQEDFLLVDIRMKDAKGERKTRDPCLTVEEAGELADWLDEISHIEGHIGPGMPDLVEPNLQIDILRTTEADIELRASFGSASMGTPGVRDYVDLVIDRYDLMRAASDLRRELERYPSREAH